MREIMMDEPLYRSLQSIAIPFDEKEVSDVIWRLYRFYIAQSSDVIHSAEIEGIDLQSRSGSIPHGTRLRRENYKGHSFYAEVRDGKIWFNENGYLTPSKAAKAAAISIGTENPSINGWKFWEYFDTSESKWKLLSELPTYRPR